MIHVSTAEKNFAENTFFVSTFLDKYRMMYGYVEAKITISAEMREVKNLNKCQI